MKTIGNMRKLFLLLALIVAGVQSAWAYDFEIKGVQYTLYTSSNGSTYSTYAVVTGYTGTAETLTIPEYVSNGSSTYRVYAIKLNNGDAPVDISSVKTLIFEGFVYLRGNSSNPTFNCPALTDIIFKGGSPTLSDSFSKYFGTRTGITAHVTDKTDEEIEAMKTSAAVWCDFEDIVPITDTLTEPFINFADSIVKDICVNNWDTNNDGELTFEEAAAVTSLGEAFKYNTQITKFNELQYFTGLTSIKAAFYGCSALEEVVVPYGVTNMRESFGNCNALKNVVIPPTVNNIERAFSTTSGPTALEHVTLPSSLTKIGEYAFASSGLKSIEIPEGVTEIGTLAFSNCKNLKMVYIPKSVTTIAGFTEVSNNLAFNACSGLESIVVDAENPVYESPNGCNAIIQKEGKKLIVGSKYTVIPEDVVTLDGYSFRRVGLTSIVIPASVTTISSYCFYQCESLTSVECKSPTPPTIKGNVFTQINSDCVLKVPQGCIEAYSAWSQYFGGGIMEAEREVTWSVLQDTGITGSKVVIARNGEDEVKTMASAFTTVNFYNQGVQKVTLKVPVGHEEQVTIYNVRILTVTSQTGAALYLTTKLGISRTKASLIINNLPQNLPKNFDTEEEAQAFINGFASYGTAEIVPTTTTVGVSDNVSIKVVLNSEDVTSQMDTSDPLYATYEVPLADLTDAVWQIEYKSIAEQMKTLRVSNLDQMEIVYERNYTDGTTVPEYFKNSETGEIAKYVERFFDDSDRENTRFIYLHVPIPESQPIRVLCNGEDVTYSKHDEWINKDRVTYIASMTQDQTWDISYDTSHKQTFIVKGGLYPEVNYEYKADDVFKGVQVGGITEVFLPDYNPDYDNTYADFTIGTLPNESFTALRNGVDVTDKFTKELRDNMWVYRFNFDNAEVAAALGVDLRDPAVWQITIGDGSSDAVEYMFIGDYDKVYASADYNNDVDYEGFEFTQQNVEGYYAGKVVENGTALGKQGAVEFWLPAGKTFRAFYDGTDMTNQFTDYYNNGHWLFVSEDDWMHQPGHHWTIIAESDLMKYDTNRDGQITIADVTKLVNKILGKE